MNAILTKPDPKKAAEFLFEISEGEAVRLVLMAPVADATPVVEVYLDKDKLATRIAELAAVNTYFMLNETSDIQGVPTRDDIVALRGIIVDIDPHETENSVDARERLDGIATGMLMGEIKPTFIIDTATAFRSAGCSRNHCRSKNTGSASRRSAWQLAASGAVTPRTASSTSSGCRTLSTTQVRKKDQPKAGPYRYRTWCFAPNEPRSRRWKHGCNRMPRTVTTAIWEGDIDRGAIMAAVGKAKALEELYSTEQIERFSSINDSQRKNSNDRSLRDDNLAKAALRIRIEDVQSAAMVVATVRRRSRRGCAAPSGKDTKYLIVHCVIAARKKLSDKSFDWWQEPKDPPNGDPSAADNDEIHIWTQAELWDVRPPEFLVANMIVKGGVGLLIGDSQSLESFLAQSLSLAIAAGLQDWQGHA